MNRYFSILLVLIGIQVGYAQYWEVGGMAGISIYHGDLSPDFSMQPPGVAAAFFVRRNVDSRLSMRMGLSFGMISATDELSSNPYYKSRNLNFNSNIFEGSLCFEFNFLPFHHHSLFKNLVSPYLVAGLGVFHHNPKTKYMDSVYELQPLGTEGQAPGEEYSLVQPSFILGAGIKIDINRQWGIIIEGATRILFFDYLDDVSGYYADASLIKGHRGSLGSVAVALSDRSVEVGTKQGYPGRQRGDVKTNDGFTMISIGIIHNIRQLRCPAW